LRGQKNRIFNGIKNNHFPQKEIRFTDELYKSKSSTIHVDLGNIVEQNENITEINTPEGVHIQ